MTLLWRRFVFAIQTDAPTPCGARLKEIVVCGELLDSGEISKSPHTVGIHQKIAEWLRR
jgi:hypothetical protein